ncbi:hypothetical protein [Pseudomonas sp. NPDC089569]|uniref:hypothetical protein n=1 Tax=Pseudomonas sp. NPDC089569 TaxID=3390722 RepID=UPI003CFDF92C
MNRARLSVLAAALIAGGIAYGIWKEDHPVSTEDLQAFVSEAPCHQIKVTHALAMTNAGSPLVHGDLWGIASDCRKEAKETEAALTKAKQWKAVQDPS